jgi:hypothetical protein
MLRYNGTYWTPQLLSSNTLSGSYVSAVGALSPTQAWAVGSGPGSSGAAIWTYNPSTKVWDFQLYANDVGFWRISTSKTGGVAFTAGNTALMRWTGSAWVQETLPVVVEYIMYVEVLDANHAWASAWTKNGTTLPQNYVLHMLSWDGSTWTLDSSSSSTNAELIEGLAAASPTVVWGLSRSSKLYRNSGSGWVLQPTSPVTLGFLEDMYAIAAGGPNAVWVGGYPNGSSAAVNKSMAFWDGVSWAPQESPSGVAPYDSVFIARDPTTAFILMDDYSILFYTNASTCPPVTYVPPEPPSPPSPPPPRPPPRPPPNPPPREASLQAPACPCARSSLVHGALPCNGGRGCTCRNACSWPPPPQRTRIERRCWRRASPPCRPAGTRPPGRVEGPTASRQQVRINSSAPPTPNPTPNPNPNPTARFACTNDSSAVLSTSTAWQGVTCTSTYNQIHFVKAV